MTSMFLWKLYKHYNTCTGDEFVQVSGFLVGYFWCNDACKETQSNFHRTTRPH